MLHIEFDFNSAELTASARRDLDRVASALADARLADGLVTIEGHTDATGSEAYNRRLSGQRATAVTSYLVQRGVAARRLTAVGFGEERPLTGYAPTDGRQRRVEIVRTW
ncbi:MAG: OmpA family protein [Acidobacteria bacterium]|nr:OmpA family protein [Acidobacteriota bacterium]